MISNMVSKIQLMIFLFHFLEYQIFGIYGTSEEDLVVCKLCECHSEIFCEGELLHDVQMSGIFKDQTEFVRHNIKGNYSEEDVVRAYKIRKHKLNNNISPGEIKKFVEKYFEPEKMVTYKLPDFNPNPAILKNIKNGNYRTWLIDLTDRWNKFGRKLPQEVKDHPDRYSYIYVPNPYVVAGGRFNEMYYWDSYWIVKGLLICGMQQTARGIIENIITLVNKYEHMPNGNRIYYTTRSQPPMLIQMAKEYYKYTRDRAFIKRHIEAFDKEMDWWFRERSVEVLVNSTTFQMYRYKSVGCTPRPEAYKIDYNLTGNANATRTLQIMTGIRSAAETGWDFSSRHVRGENNTNIGELNESDPDNLIYVDLNSIMQSNFKIMSNWHQKFGNQYYGSLYQEIADSLADAIDKVLWNHQVGVWLDYDLVTKRSRNYFYGSNITPLWTRSFNNIRYVSRVIDYLVNEGIVSNSNDSSKYFCVPTSLHNSSMQWDFPNCWAPLQAFLIQGLYNYKKAYPRAEKIAFNIAQEWINTMYKGYQDNAKMYEKYNALRFGRTGDGGEYEPQTGFGWTNGFCFELFNTWGSKLQ